jgi:hypothetical protein
MKITSQSAEELVLKEGSTSGIIVGSGLIVAGIAGGILLRAATPYAIWIALAAILIGIGVILFSSSITVVANRARGQISYEKKRIVGTQNSTYAIADVFRIETRKQWQVQNSAPSGNQSGTIPQPVLVAQSVIIFKDGRELALDHQKTSSSTTVGSVVLMGGQGAETATAAQVANFLNVPFQEIAPPNMLGTIQF